MKGRSEFQIILENKLTGSKSGDASVQPGGDDVEFTNSPKSQDFIDALSSLFFSQGPVKQNISFGKIKKSTAPFYFEVKESPRRPGEEIKLAGISRAETPAPQKPAPAVKVRRSRNFDQIKAMNIFVKFGEKEINDYATDEDIKSAYRRLAKKFHPDAGAQGDLNFKIISSAYRKLIF